MRTWKLWSSAYTDHRQSFVVMNRLMVIHWQMSCSLLSPIISRYSKISYYIYMLRMQLHAVHSRAKANNYYNECSSIACILHDHLLSTRESVIWSLSKRKHLSVDMPTCVVSSLSVFLAKIVPWHHAITSHGFRSCQNVPWFDNSAVRALTDRHTDGTDFILSTADAGENDNTHRKEFSASELQKKSLLSLKSATQTGENKRLLWE